MALNMKLLKESRDALPIKWPYEYAIFILLNLILKYPLMMLLDWLTRRFDLEIKRDNMKH